VAIDGSWGGEPPFVVAPDGTAYGWVNEPGETAALAAFDPAGRARPGWPFRARAGSEPATLVLASDGSVLAGTFVAAVGQQDRGGELELHRLTRDGREVAGWPFRSETIRGCWPVVEGPGGAVHVGRCTADHGADLEIASLDPSGRMADGWPAVLRDGRMRPGTWDATVEVAEDGTVYALIASGRWWDPAARFVALSTDGRARPGWPVALEASDAGFRLAPGGRVVITSYRLPDGPPGSFVCLEADATIVTELGTGGRSVAGWPRREKGWATPPAISGDGTVSYLAKDVAVVLRPDGSVRPDWPVRLPGLDPACDFSRPVLGPDGTLYIAFDGLHALDGSGHQKPGWPFDPEGGLAGWPCATVAEGGPAPVIDPDGTVYVATRAPSNGPDVAGQAEITALDRRGRVVSGWPYRLPLAWEIGPAGSYLDAAEGQLPGGVRTLHVAAGRLYATVIVCGDPARSGTQLFALEPDGSIAR
jgi:hypothetical protein